MKGIPFLLTVVFVLVFLETAVLSADSDRPFYRYVDRNGVEVFTDDLSRVPAEYRSSAKIVVLPPAVKMPAPGAPSHPAPTSFMTRLRKWVEGQPAAYRVMIVGVLPMALLSVWVLYFLRKHTDVPFVKFLLRLGMLAIVVSTAYLCYFIYLRVQAGQVHAVISVGTEGISSPQEKAKELKKDEADRLKRIEETVDQSPPIPKGTDR